MILSKTRTVWLALTPVVVALGIAATVVAQTSVDSDIPPDEPFLIQGQGNITAGKIVQSPQGETIGTVRGLVPTFRAHGIAADYVLIATRTGTIAIPYGAMSHRVHDTHLVMDYLWLADAPHVEEDQIHNLASTYWREEADSYWQSHP